MQEKKEVPEREKQVNAQIDRLGNHIDQADNLLNSLHQRLETVLLPEPEPAEPAEKEPTDLVPLAYVLRCKANRISYQNSRMESILHRLEL